jgi:hypothetical protein
VRAKRANFRVWLKAQKQVTVTPSVEKAFKANDFYLDCLEKENKELWKFLNKMGIKSITK